MGRGTHGHMGAHSRLPAQDRSLADNLPEVTRKFPLHMGYFGMKAHHARLRHIESGNPLQTAKDFFQRLTIGANEIRPLDNGKGVKAVMSDGATVTFRPVSSSDGTPAVNIVVNGSTLVKRHKIHFIKKG